MNLTQYDDILVIDLEATCCQHDEFPRTEMEIIEIGAVMVATSSLTIVDEFQTFIHPVRHPQLTSFCCELTTITQAQVDQAPSYPDAIAHLQAWLSSYPNYVFASWGDYDRKQFQQDSQYHQIPYPFPAEHINLKQGFARHQTANQRYGMAEALERVGITLEGTYHRGIDDARNIAKLLPYSLGIKQIDR